MTHSDSEPDYEIPSSLDNIVIPQRNLFSKSYIVAGPEGPGMTRSESRAMRSETPDVHIIGTSNVKSAVKSAETDAATDAGTDAEDDVDPTDLKWHKIYAVTVNICPAYRFNNKLWKSYDHAKQITILNKLHTKLTSNCSLVTEKLYFEVCPVLKSIHFHAKLRGLPDHLNDYSDAFNKYLPKTVMKDKSKQWRTVKFDELSSKTDIEQWDKYITKDQ